MAGRVIQWSITAFNQFEAAIGYIAEDSPQNAEKVRIDILNNIEKVLLHPELYPVDKLKLQNSGNFRAFELHRYRIAYYFDAESVRILRVRHTSQEPKSY
jgi:plasmid stabilization system protein ParE